MPTPAALKAFRSRIWRWFRKNARTFPWRETRDPYHILVSEIMLQQTQTERVKRFYERFISSFPTLPSLAKAPTRELLMLWQGLGYNRRALALRSLAREVCANHGGVLPRTIAELEELPGVGPYTAGAVLAFAFGTPVVLIETNIRNVLLEAFFRNRKNVKDAEILPVIAACVSARDPRRWYWALMDYGASLKSRSRGLNRLSAHYHRQSPFKGSNRELRGKIVKLLAEGRPGNCGLLCRITGEKKERVRHVLQALANEGFL